MFYVRVLLDCKMTTSGKNDFKVFRVHPSHLMQHQFRSLVPPQEKYSSCLLPPWVSGWCCSYIKLHSAQQTPASVRKHTEPKRVQSFPGFFIRNPSVGFFLVWCVDQSIWSSAQLPIVLLSLSLQHFCSNPHTEDDPAWLFSMLSTTSHPHPSILSCFQVCLCLLRVWWGWRGCQRGSTLYCCFPLTHPQRPALADLSLARSRKHTEQCE